MAKRQNVPIHDIEWFSIISRNMQQNPDYNVSFNETESDEQVSISIMKTPAPPESSRKRKSNDKR